MILRRLWNSVFRNGMLNGNGELMGRYSIKKTLVNTVNFK